MLKDLIKYIKEIRLFNNLFLLFLIINSCITPKDEVFEGQEVLKEFQVIFPYLSIIDSTWDIVYLFNDEDLVQFEASKNDSTLKFNYVKLTKIPEENWGFPSSSFSYCYDISNITYSWEDKEKDTYIHYTAKLDTIYHFYWNTGYSWTGDPFFIKGKYTYLYEYNRLTPDQMRYYEQNKDSLTRVLGDDLPDLPSIEAVKSSL